MLMTMTKHPTSFRLSDEGIALLAKLAERLGLSQASTIELAVRKLAKREGVK